MFPKLNFFARPVELMQEFKWLWLSLASERFAAFFNGGHQLNAHT